MSQLYRIKLDGTEIFRAGNQDMTLLEPELSLELGEAGSLTFRLPPGHVFYDAVHLLTSTVEVLEEDTPIWSGRPTEIALDFLGCRRVYCEGALAYLNDTVQPVHEYSSVSIRTFFTNLIASHNAAVSASRRLTVGNLTVTDRNVYRKLNREQTFDAVRSMCLNTNGGWLQVRREGGVNYIDWLKSLPNQTGQEVCFGLNLMDLTEQRNGADIVTQIIPLGEKDDNGNPITVSSVNGGSVVVSSAEAVAEYGAITQTVTFSGVATPAALLAEAQDWLSSRQWDGLTLDVDAADLHALNEEYTPFRVGQKVRLRSSPHGINKVLPITRLVTRLDSARKTATLGSLPRKTLTKIVKEQEEQGRSNPGGDGGSGGGGDGGGGSNWSILVNNSLQTSGTIAIYDNSYPFYVYP